MHLQVYSAHCAQELWLHGAANGWDPKVLWNHIHFLGNAILSTKESLEDIIGDASDHQVRDQKLQGSSEERVFYHNAMSQRLKNVQYLKLADGDLSNSQARKFSINRQLVFGENMRIDGSVAKQVKVLCRKGDGLSQAHLPSSGWSMIQTNGNVSRIQAWRESASSTPIPALRMELFVSFCISCTYPGATKT